MKIETRSYNPGPVFRPKPSVLEKSEMDLVIIATSWTSHADSDKIAQLINSQLEMAMGEDMTTLQEVAGQANKAVDKLKQAMQAAAQTLYRQNNVKQIRVLAEALVVQKIGSALLWAQVGQPNLYLFRKGRLAPLAFQPDHSVLSRDLAPLPMVGLGLEAQTVVHTGVTRCQPEDQLLLLAQSWEPSWPHWKDSPTFRDLTTELINAQPELAYWCGLVDL